MPPRLEDNIPQAARPARLRNSVSDNTPIDSKYYGAFKKFYSQAILKVTIPGGHSYIGTCTSGVLKHWSNRLNNPSSLTLGVFPSISLKAIKRSFLGVTVLWELELF